MESYVGRSWKEALDQVLILTEKIRTYLLVAISQPIPNPDRDFNNEIIKLNSEIFQTFHFQAKYQQIRDKVPTKIGLLNLITCIWRTKFQESKRLLFASDLSAKDIELKQIVENFVCSYDPMITIKVPLMVIDDDDSFNLYLLALLWINASKCCQLSEVSKYGALIFNVGKCYSILDEAEHTAVVKANTIRAILRNSLTTPKVLETLNRLDIFETSYDEAEEEEEELGDTELSSEEKERIYQELDGFLSKPIYMFSANAPFARIKLYESHIGINRKYIENIESTKKEKTDEKKNKSEEIKEELNDSPISDSLNVYAAKTFLIIFHELAHCKRDNHQGRKLYLSPRIYRCEAGVFFEKRMFGRVVERFDLINDELANLILDPKTWESLSKLRKLGERLGNIHNNEESKEDVRPKQTLRGIMVLHEPGDDYEDDDDHGNLHCFKHDYALSKQYWANSELQSE